MHERERPHSGSHDTIALQLDTLRREIEAAKAQLDVIIRSARDRARLFGEPETRFRSEGGRR